MYEKEVEAYKKFRNERLVPERNLVKENINGIELEINDYERLKEQSQKLDQSTDSNPVKIQLDLGSNYSVDFEIFDKDFVLVSVGFGFYCQMTWNEAEKFCVAKIEILRRKQEKISGKLDKIEEHLKLTDEIIAELTK